MYLPRTYSIYRAVCTGVHQILSSFYVNSRSSALVAQTAEFIFSNKLLGMDNAEIDLVLPRLNVVILQS